MSERALLIPAKGLVIPDERLSRGGSLVNFPEDGREVSLPLTPYEKRRVARGDLVKKDAKARAPKRAESKSAENNGTSKGS